MSLTIDDVIFVLSSDTFAGSLLAGVPGQEVQAVTLAARDTVRDLIGANDNYYLCVEFSDSRRKATEDHFSAALAAGGVSAETLQRVRGLWAELPRYPECWLNAAYAIKSVAARLFWLETDDFDLPVPVEALDALSQVEAVGFPDAVQRREWLDRWHESASEWDTYLKSLMDGIDDMPCTKFIEMRSRNPSELEFLAEWRHRLEPAAFSLLVNVIASQAKAELQALDADAASAVDQVIASA